MNIFSYQYLVKQLIFRLIQRQRLTIYFERQPQIYLAKNYLNVKSKNIDHSVRSFHPESNLITGAQRNNGWRLCGRYTFKGKKLMFERINIIHHRYSIRFLWI